MEAAIRLALDDAVNGALPCKFYFVALGNDKDPSPELLKRLNSYPHPVKAYSECKKHKIRMGEILNDYEYRDRRTKGRGIKVRASIDKWLSPNSARVFYGWDQYSMATIGVTVEMLKIDGKWVVKKILSTVQT